MSVSLSVAASRPLVKHPAESLMLGVDFHRLLAASELLTTPVEIVADPADLTIASPAINAVPFANDLGGSVPAGAGVQFRVSGGTVDNDYRLTITANTTGGNIRTGVCILQVRGA